MKLIFLIMTISILSFSISSYGLTEKECKVGGYLDCAHGKKWYSIIDDNFLNNLCVANPEPDGICSNSIFTSVGGFKGSKKVPLYYKKGNAKPSSLTKYELEKFKILKPDIDFIMSLFNMKDLKGIPIKIYPVHFTYKKIKMRDGKYTYDLNLLSKGKYLVVISDGKVDRMIGYIIASVVPEGMSSSFFLKKAKTKYGKPGVDHHFKKKKPPYKRMLIWEKKHNKSIMTHLLFEKTYEGVHLLETVYFNLDLFKKALQEIVTLNEKVEKAHKRDRIQKKFKGAEDVEI